MSKFHALFYNFVAKRIREVTPTDDSRESGIRRNQMYKLAAVMAMNFLKDNDLFDAKMFMNACSPDAEKFPWGDGYN